MTETTHRRAGDDLAQQSETHDGIAVVGMACRVPGARHLSDFWDLMMGGVDAISSGLPTRLGIDWSAVRDLPVQPQDERWGGFLQDVDEFDAEFFGLSDRAAVRMDPAQRLLMETAWEAIEDAGVPPSRLAGSRTGVYTAFAVMSDYWEMLLAADKADLYAAVGAGSRACAAGQLSHALDLRGPSLALDAACAGSLLALHQACRSIRDDETDAALVCGVNLQLSPAYTLAFARGRLMSPTGTCRFGDRAADGYVRSEGVAAVLLKRESAARADGDRIYAVVRGSGVSNDGRSGRSLVAASAAGQMAAIRAAYRDAGLTPADVDYVEAHGTGTPVGDREELTALAEVVGRRRDPDRPCLLGSVKSNIGHTEAASGLISLIKTALAIRHGTIPRTLHVTRPQPVLSGSGLAMVRENSAWPERDAPRRAGVSSFGLSGTNVHVVLEEPAPEPARWQTQSRIPAQPLLGFVLPLSARSPEALRETARGYARLVAESGATTDICYSAAVRRDHHPWRAATVAADRDGLVAALRNLASGSVPPVDPDEPPTRVIYVMPDAAPLTARMERTLTHAVEPYKAAAAECERELRAHADAGTPADERALGWAQQVALTAVWRHWGVLPDLIVGQGIGEVAAATVGGLITPADAPAAIDDWAGRALATRRTGASRPSRRSGRRPGNIPLHLVTNRSAEPDRADLSVRSAARTDPAEAVRDLVVPGGRTVFVVFGPATELVGELELSVVADGGTADVLDLHDTTDRHDPLWLFEALGRAYTAGCDPDWSQVLPRGRYVDVQTSPWQRRGYWFTDEQVA